MSQDLNQSQALSWEDLRQHGISILKVFHGLISFFYDQVMRRHFPLATVFMAIAAAVSIGLLYQKSQTYEVNTTFVYGDLHPKIFGDMIGKLNAIINYGQIDRAAALTGLTSNQVQKVLKVEVADTRGRSLVKNYTLGKEPILITVQLSDYMSEDSLQEAVAFYLNNNPFTAERADLKKRLWQEELQYADQKIKTIDSLLNKLYSDKANSPIDQNRVTIENAEGKNAYELLSFSRELLQRKAELENQLANPDNVFAIDNFLILPREQFSPGSVIKHGITGAIVGFLLATLIVFWRKVILPQL